MHIQAYRVIGKNNNAIKLELTDGGEGQVHNAIWFGDASVFEEYLLNNTKYDTASTSRHDFGEVYSENGEDFIKFNLQVRFR